MNRFCSSGLQTIAHGRAAHHRRRGQRVSSAGGVESISLVQNEMNKHHFEDEWLHRHKPEIYWPMLQTAENVAKHYGIAREDQDRYGVQSQQRAAAAHAAGKFRDEIVPIDVAHEGRRQADRAGDHRATSPPPRTRASAPTRPTRACRRSSPRIEGGVIAAGNASQFSDGAAACVVMDAKLAERRGLAPLGIFRGFAVAGCEPDEMGIGPVFAVPKLLERAGKRMGDIDLWELNEAFAVQVLYCRDRLGIPERAAQRQRRRDRASATPTA